jgi:thioredoxin 1
VFEVTDATFEHDVLRADTPVVLDFWAPWCGPCRIVAPHLEELDAQRDDLRVVKLNVDDNPQTARQYGVMSIPTLIVFKDGQEKARVIGARGKDAILREIEPHLAA